MNDNSELPLLNRLIALPETRQLDVLAQLLEKRGADTLRCPLVAILDAPDPAPIEEWLLGFIDKPFDTLILLTGEGLRRLLGFAERAGLREQFIETLAKTHKLTRGPKPGRALKEIGLQSDAVADEPTTDGVIATLERQAIAGRRIGVQLYGSDPNLKLITYLEQRGAVPVTVAPYIYASKSDDEKVLDLIDRIAVGAVDVIAFTSQPQYKRLADVARAHQKEEILLKGLAAIKVAAVGPVVHKQLQEAGVRVDMMPESSFFMKPLVTEIVKALALRPTAAG